MPVPVQKTKIRLLLPFILTIVIFLTDQITKLWIVRNIPPNSIGHIFLNGFFRIIHVQNTGIAFSMGDSWAYWVRLLLFILLPLAVMIGVVIYYFRSNEFTPFQRWIIALVLGGGLGNLTDRIFRPDGVVDFLDFRFYGILGMERFPTFNVADSSIVVGGVLLILAFLIQGEKKHDE